MKGRKIFALFAALLFCLPLLPLGLASDIDSMTVYVNGIKAFEGSDFYGAYYAVPALEREKIVAITALFKSGTTLHDVKVKAWISGYREEIEAETEKFDIFPGLQYSKSLFLRIPEDIEEGYYTLYVKVESSKELTGGDEAKITVAIQKISKLKILSIEPWSYKQEKDGFKAGTIINTEVVVKNLGREVVKDLFLKLSVPSLGIKRVTYLGDVKETVKKVISFKLPEGAEGNYALEVEAFNSDLSVKETVRFNVIGKKVRVEVEEKKSDWDKIAMIITIILAVAIIVLLVMLLKQKAEEKEESYY